MIRIRRSALGFVSVEESTCLLLVAQVFLNLRKIMI